MKRTRIESDAERDLTEIAEWYEEQRPGLGAAFLARLDATLSDIAEAPTHYPYLHSMTRRALMRKFPYVVLFRDYPDEIVILGVLHGGRDPNAARRRTW